MNLEKYQNCPKCGALLKQIPIKRIDSVFIIELYCEHCGESMTLYPDIDKITFKRAKFF
jgi:transcription elongation factor Elf1